MAAEQKARQGSKRTSAAAESPEGGIQPINRATLPQAIVKSITELIATRVWRPGDLIPSEKELARQFQVGRSTVREAVKSLVVLGVLDARAGEGSFVRQTDSRSLASAFEWGLLLGEDNLDDLLALRILVEVECVRLAAERRTDEQAVKLLGLLRQMRGRGARDYVFRDLGNEFHVTIAQAAGNALYETLVTTIQQIIRIWFPYGQRPRPRALAEHLAIGEAIVARDPDAAAIAMRRHIDSTREILLSAVGENRRAEGDDAAPLKPAESRGRRKAKTADAN